MKYIRLTNCELDVVVDDEDFERLSRYSWRLGKDKHVRFTQNVKQEKGSAQRYKQKTVYIHHMVMPPKDGLLTDHINRNPLDNRKENLRYATHSDNQINRLRKNKWGYRGVSKHNNKWGVKVCKNSKREEKYGFSTPEEAARWYDETARRLHGEFAVLNFP